MTENEIEQSMIKGMEQALAFAKGAKDPDCIVHIPAEIDVRRIRKKFDMNQKIFAEYFGVKVRTVQDWEQGRRIPSGAARVLLVVIDHEPKAVRRALEAA